jgi:hypothetical protein
MRSAFAAVVCVVPLVSCATSRPRPEPVNVSAAGLNMPHCPDDVGSAVKGIDPAADWRQVSGPEGVSYCVPAEWTVPVDRVMRQGRIANGWAIPGTAWVTAMRSSTVDIDYPKGWAAKGTMNDFFDGTIAGNRVELWHRPLARSNDEQVKAAYEDARYVSRNAVQNRARLSPFRGGYEAYAIWRDQEVVFTAGGSNLETIAVIRQIFQTARFDRAP